MQNTLSTDFTDEAICPLSQALEDIICLMKVGEQCQLKLTMDTTLATSPLLKGAPNDCTLLYKLHLVSLTRAPEVWTLSAQSRQVLASRHKAIGTEQFKLNNIYGAGLHYSKALKFLIPLNVSTQEIDTLKRALYLNLAACQLKLKQYSNVVRNCTCVLKSGVTDVKALYRRGQALQALKDLDGAKRDFTKALELEPTNNAFVKLLSQLEQEIKIRNSKFGHSLKKMFT